MWRLAVEDRYVGATVDANDPRGVESVVVEYVLPHAVGHGNDPDALQHHTVVRFLDPSGLCSVKSMIRREIRNTRQTRGTQNAPCRGAAPDMHQRVAALTDDFRETPAVHPDRERILRLHLKRVVLYAKLLKLGDHRAAARHNRILYAGLCQRRSDLYGASLDATLSQCGKYLQYLHERHLTSRNSRRPSPRLCR